MHKFCLNFEWCFIFYIINCLLTFFQTVIIQSCFYFCQAWTCKRVEPWKRCPAWFISWLWRSGIGKLVWRQSSKSFGRSGNKIRSCNRNTMKGNIRWRQQRLSDWNLPFEEALNGFICKSKVINDSSFVSSMTLFLCNWNHPWVDWSKKWRNIRFFILHHLQHRKLKLEIWSL